jgi:hypothetical protein
MGSRFVTASQLYFTSHLLNEGRRLVHPSDCPDLTAQCVKPALLPYLERREPALVSLQLDEVDQPTRKNGETIGHAVVPWARKFESQTSQALNLAPEPFFYISFSHARLL